MSALVICRERAAQIPGVQQCNRDTDGGQPRNCDDANDQCEDQYDNNNCLRQAAANGERAQRSLMMLTLTRRRRVGVVPVRIEHRSHVARSAIARLV